MKKLWSTLKSKKSLRARCQKMVRFAPASAYTTAASIAFMFLTAKAKKNVKLTVLEQRKAYNICKCTCSCLTNPDIICSNAAILLGHLKLPFEKIKEAILACDDSVLSEQHLRQMEAFAPDKKEVNERLSSIITFFLPFFSVPWIYTFP